MIKHFNVSFIINTSNCVLCKNWRTDDSFWLAIFCFKIFGVGLREIFALTRLTQPRNCALFFLHKWTYCVCASGGIQKGYLADIFQYTILNCALAIQRMDWGAGPRLVSCPTRWYLFHNPDKKEILHNAQQCPSPRVAWACYTMHGPRYIFQISELVQNDPLFGYNINIIWRDHNFKYGRHIRHIRQMFVIFEDFEICENIIYHVF